MLWNLSYSIDFLGYCSGGQRLIRYRLQPLAYSLSQPTIEFQWDRTWGLRGDASSRKSSTAETESNGIAWENSGKTWKHRGKDRCGLTLDDDLGLDGGGLGLVGATKAVLVGLEGVPRDGLFFPFCIIVALSFITSELFGDSFCCWFSSVTIDLSLGKVLLGFALVTLVFWWKSSFSRAILACTPLLRATGLTWGWWGSWKMGCLWPLRPL